MVLGEEWLIIKDSNAGSCYGGINCSGRGVNVICHDIRSIPISKLCDNCLAKLKDLLNKKNDR